MCNRTSSAPSPGATMILGIVSLFSGWGIGIMSILYYAPAVGIVGLGLAIVGLQAAVTGFARIVSQRLQK